jgi:hypothetical protein
MNIFYFYDCPEKSAQAQPDKMLVKMPLETAQMLCTAHRELDGDEYADEVGLYGREHGSITKLKDALEPHPDNIDPNPKMTPVAQAMPDKYKDDDPIKAYRNYCINEKHYAKWEQGRAKPNWWTTKK